MRIKGNQYFVSLILKITSLFVSFGYIILISRYLGPQLKGSYSVIMNYALLAATIFGMGMYQAYPVFKDKVSGFKTILISNFKYYYCLGLLTTLLVTVLYYLISDKFNVLVPIIMILVVHLIIIKQLNYVQMIENPSTRNLTVLGIQLLDVILVLILYIFVTASFSVLIVFLVLKNILYLIVISKVYNVNFFSVKPSKSKLSELLIFGFVPMISLLLMTMNYRIDVLMLEYYVPLSSIGVYSVGVSLAEKVWLIPDAFKDVLLSRLVKGKKKEEVAIVSRVSVLITLIIIIIFSLIGEQLVNLVFGLEYNESYEITLIMFVGVIGMIFYKVVYSYNIANNFRKENMIILLISAIINVVLNILMIPAFGIQGAAYSSVLSYMICGLAFLMFIRRKSGLYVKDFIFVNKNDVAFIMEKIKFRRSENE